MITWIAAFVLSAGGAQADGYYKVTINGKSCSDLLTTTKAPPAAPKTPLDYQISDLEGLFFTYLAKMQELDELSPSRLPFFMKDMLSMKAEILNDAMDLLPYVAGSPMEEARQDELLNTLYQIVDTMGVPAKVYGFEVDEEGFLNFPGKKRVKASTSAGKVSVAKDAIGFLGGKAPDRDLADGVHRSIGFATHKITEEKAPLRKGGHIQRSVSEENPNNILIVDGETGKIYSLPITRVAFMAGKIDGKSYQLDFNNDIDEWVVVVENLNNPTGRIGFQYCPPAQFNGRIWSGGKL